MSAHAETTTKTNAEPNKLGDTRKACAVLDCSRSHLRKFVIAKRLTPIRLGRRMTRYDMAEVYRLADELIAAARNAA